MRLLSCGKFGAIGVYIVCASVCGCVFVHVCVCVYVCVRVRVQECVSCISACKDNSQSTGANFINILHAYFAPMFLLQELQSQNVTREICTKHFCTKNWLVKCWWNWIRVFSLSPIIWPVNRQLRFKEILHSLLDQIFWRLKNCVYNNCIKQSGPESNIYILL